MRAGRCGRCACGYERATIDADGYYVSPGNRQSARKLAQKLGVSHTWVNRLIRRFQSDPGRQERARTWGRASMEQLREERAKRQGDYLRYRVRRIQRPGQRPDPMREEPERWLKQLLRWQRNFEKNYGYSPEWLPEQLSASEPSSQPAAPPQLFPADSGQMTAEEEKNHVSTQGPVQFVAGPFSLPVRASGASARLLVAAKRRRPISFTDQEC
jgi:hypothetical protein